MIRPRRDSVYSSHARAVGEGAPSARARSSGAAAHRGRIAPFVRSLIISLLVSIGLLAVVLLSLPEHMTQSPWVFVSLVAATPVLAVSIRALLANRRARGARDRDE